MVPGQVEDKIGGGVVRTFAPGLNTNLGSDLARFVSSYATVSDQRIESETRFLPFPTSTVTDNYTLGPATDFYNPFGLPIAFPNRPVETSPAT